jgi:hypothetical protein
MFFFFNSGLTLILICVGTHSQREKNIVPDNTWSQNLGVWDRFKGFWIQKLIQSLSHPLILHWGLKFFFHLFTNLDTKSIDEKDFELILNYKPFEPTSFPKSRGGFALCSTVIQRWASWLLLNIIKCPRCFANKKREKERS